MGWQQSKMLEDTPLKCVLKVWGELGGTASLSRSQLQMLCMTLWPGLISQETRDRHWLLYGPFDGTHRTTLRLILQDLQPGQIDYDYPFQNVQPLCYRNSMAQIKAREDATVTPEDYQKDNYPLDLPPYPNPLLPLTQF